MKVEEIVNEIRKLKSELTKKEEGLFEHDKVINENFEKLQCLRTIEDDKRYRSKIYDEAEKWDKKNSEYENLKFEQEKLIYFLIKHAMRRRDYWNDVILCAKHHDFDELLSKMAKNWENLKFEIINYATQKRDYWNDAILHAKNRDFDEPL